MRTIKQEAILEEGSILELYAYMLLKEINGEVKKDALYELETVANHFGGEYAKKVLKKRVK